MRIISLIFLLFISTVALAQKGQSSQSFLVGYSPITFNNFYTYQVFTFQFIKEWDIEILGFKSKISAQPQANRIHHVYDSRTGKRANGWEIGASPGLDFMLVETESVRFYFGGSIGMVHVNASHARQKTGFLFNEEAHIGFETPISDQFALVLRTGYRHLSNANWRTLNGGVDIWHTAVGMRF